MEKDAKKINTPEKTQPVHKENYHGHIASSDYYKSRPIEWKYLEGEPTMYCLLTNQYQRMWMDEQKEWYDRRNPPRRRPVNVIKKYVEEFKDKVHSVPKINTRLCRAEANKIKSETKLKKKLGKTKQKKEKLEKAECGTAGEKKTEEVKESGRIKSPKVVGNGDKNVSVRSKEGTTVISATGQETGRSAKASARSVKSKASGRGEKAKDRVKELFAKNEGSVRESISDETFAAENKLKSGRSIASTHRSGTITDFQDGEEDFVSKRNGLDDDEPMFYKMYKR